MNPGYEIKKAPLGGGVRDISGVAGGCSLLIRRVLNAGTL
jgi:hypothetical protein